MKPLPRSFYLNTTPRIAQDLLGKYIVRKFRGETLVGKIVETEAYCTGDPAAHSYRGKTKRNAVMFETTGHLYVYFTYGMHWCANVVTQRVGVGEAVLIRAVEPVAGIEAMMNNRPGHRLHNLTSGPAKFCQAFALTGKENGIDLLGNKIYIARGERIPASHIKRSRRIGINVGTEKLWRFYIKDNPWVSRKPTSKPARS